MERIGNGRYIATCVLPSTELGELGCATKLFAFRVAQQAIAFSDCQEATVYDALNGKVLGVWKRGKDGKAVRGDLR